MIKPDPMWKTRMERCGALSASFALTTLLAACGMFGGSADRLNPPGAPASAPPVVAAPLPVVKAAGETVTIDDSRSGSPIELRLDQQLVVRLRYDIATASQWELSDFVAGALARPGPARFELHNGEAATELGGEQLWRFKPVAAGTTVLNFAYRTPRSRDAASRTATFTVTVR